MISYKDTTFCPYHEFCKHGATCPKALTEKVKKDAEAWWLMATGGKEDEGAPLMRYVAIPTCFVGNN
jgi:hypothetical protein